ncbi:MAG: C10 family peptidase [Candidatus Eisenbacteria sp.]|nr:C10 family peptidase [Candidatus Eisenbacteria bacterium]
MKAVVSMLGSILIMNFALACPSGAEIATMAEAQDVAANWVALTMHNEGSWGRFTEAEVHSVKPILRDGLPVGYYCQISPTGHVVVGLHKGLPPVIAHSTSSSVDPAASEGLPEILRRRMGYDVDAIEEKLGPVEKVGTADFVASFGIDYSRQWDELTVDPESYKRMLAADIDMKTGPYTAGTSLVTANWTQGEPFNWRCPSPGPESDCDDPYCAVGCVGLAAAQIVHYWNWPPYWLTPAHTFHWWEMPDSLSIDSDPAETFAVGDLCFIVSDVIETEFCSGGDSGPCASGAYVTDMMDGYPDLTYDTPNLDVRYSFPHPPIPPETWFAMIQDEINGFRPIQYRIVGHSVVIDGWRIQGGIKQYHANCGWGGYCPEDMLPGQCHPEDGSNTWYTLDELIWSDWEDEFMVTHILPSTSLTTLLGLFGIGNYPVNILLPYRYFYAYEYTGYDITFAAGQYLQCRADVNITCTGNPGQSIRFYGDVSGLGETHIYNRGRPTRGLRIDDGAIAIYPNGTLHLYE